MSSPATTSSSNLFRRTRDAEAELQLPAGFRFHPTDEELVLYYLRRRAANLPLPVPIIAEVDIYKHDPWDLPSLALFGSKEWYFFTPRDRKYPNGSRPNRAAASGYWKATGADKPVTPAGEPRAMGIKKALVFYAGKAPRGVKTNWIMHEYRLTGVSREPKAARGNGNKGAAGSLRLDDWVLCRLYNKKNNWEKEAQQFMQMMRTQMELGVPEPSSFSGAAAAADSADSSHRTPESDIDNEVSFADEFDEAKYTVQEASPSMDLGYAHQQQFQPQPQPHPQQQQQQQQQQQLPVFGGVVKEEQTTTTNYFYTNTTAPVMPNNTATTTTATTNDWYLDLKLDDLQSPFPAFGQPGQDPFLSPTSSSFQDWFFSSGSLNSPMLPRTASQISLLNF